MSGYADLVNDLRDLRLNIGQPRHIRSLVDTLGSVVDDGRNVIAQTDVIDRLRQTYHRACADRFDEYVLVCNK